MTADYISSLVSIVILDYKRPFEAELLLASLKKHAHFPYELVYVSNGGDQGYVQEFYNQGLIDILVLSKENGGTGLGTRLGFKAASGAYVMYLQVDQWLGSDISSFEISDMVNFLVHHPECFYIDLAGNQGHGNYSERAGFLNRERYLNIPELGKAYGGPGPFAHIQWSENGVQEHIKKNNLNIVIGPKVFGDNGKNSVREYPCGGILMLSTDEKRLTIIKQIKKRADFPNLKLTDAEWELILDEKWIDGTIPEGHRDSSFVAWKNVITIANL